jgi:hypothetical protein
MAAEHTNCPPEKQVQPRPLEKRHMAFPVVSRHKQLLDMPEGCAEEDAGWAEDDALADGAAFAERAGAALVAGIARGAVEASAGRDGLRALSELATAAAADGAGSGALGPGRALVLLTGAGWLAWRA